MRLSPYLAVKNTLNCMLIMLAMGGLSFVSAQTPAPTPTANFSVAPIFSTAPISSPSPVSTGETCQVEGQRTERQLASPHQLIISGLANDAMPNLGLNGYERRLMEAFHYLMQQTLDTRITAAEMREEYQDYFQTLSERARREGVSINGLKVRLADLRLRLLQFTFLYSDDEQVPCEVWRALILSALREVRDFMNAGIAAGNPIPNELLVPVFEAIGIASRAGAVTESTGCPCTEADAPTLSVGTGSENPYNPE